MVFWKDKEDITEETIIDRLKTQWTIPRMEKPKPLITGFESVKNLVQNVARRNK